MADKEPTRSERRYSGKSEAKDERPEGKKGTPSEAAAEHKPEDGHMDERMAMRKRHETEHRDLHGQHRDAMRDMHKRQEAEMTAMNDRQGAPMSGDADGLAPAAGAAAGPAGA